MIVGIDTSVLVRVLTGEPRDLALVARAFLASPGIEGSGEVQAVLATPNLESAKPGFIDRVIHLNYLRSGAEEVATFERAAAKLPKVTVLAP